MDLLYLKKLNKEGIAKRCILRKLSRLQKLMRTKNNYNKALKRTNEELVHMVQQLKENMRNAEVKISELNVQLVQALASKNLYQEKLCRLVSKIYGALADSTITGEQLSMSMEPTNCALINTSEEHNPEFLQRDKKTNIGICNRSKPTCLEVPETSTEIDTPHSPCQPISKKLSTVLSPVSSEQSTLVDEAGPNDDQEIHSEVDTDMDDTELTDSKRDFKAAVTIVPKRETSIKLECETGQQLVNSKDSTLRAEANGSISLFMEDPNRRDFCGMPELASLPFPEVDSVHLENTCDPTRVNSDVLNKEDCDSPSFSRVIPRRRKALSPVHKLLLSTGAQISQEHFFTDKAVLLSPEVTRRNQVLKEIILNPVNSNTIDHPDLYISKSGSITDSIIDKNAVASTPRSSTKKKVSINDDANYQDASPSTIPSGSEKRTTACKGKKSNKTKEEYSRNTRSVEKSLNHRNHLKNSKSPTSQNSTANSSFMNGRRETRKVVKSYKEPNLNKKLRR